MQKQIQYAPDWWHERPTKSADLPSKYQSFGEAGGANHGHVWQKAGLVVSLMFALVLSLISMMARG